MTPEARVQAAIECLDPVLAGQAAEQVLTAWARRSRFAGSKDRAAVRDHVFDALRCRRSFAALGGAESGRGLMLGALRAAGLDAEAVFSGSGHAPAPLSGAEQAAGRAPAPGAEALDLPDWVWPLFRSALGDRAEAAAQALRRRAPVHCRVNLARASVSEAQAALAAEGIAATPHPASPSALELGEGARRLRMSQAFAQGRVELQDAASQAVVDALPIAPGMRVLDYCAGGGGKTLAMAARGGTIFAHDAAPARMRDLPARARRAGAKVEILASGELSAAAPFDIILCDVPCSGSGAWRRSPDGKWRLTPQRLDELAGIQASILDDAARLVAPGGTLAYATCSVLEQENSLQIQRFLRQTSSWELALEKAWNMADGTDGFYTAHLTGKRAQGYST